jgi:hypothetical protein
MKDVDEEGAVNTGSNLFVTGIAPRLTEGDVSRLFDKYGEVESCSIMLDPHTKESRGFGFVKMVTAEQADAAKEGLQGEVIEGRTLSIEKARRARPRTPTPGKYFGPPKRGKSTTPLNIGKALTGKKVTLAVLLAVAEVAIVIDTMIDLVVATAADDAMTTVADDAMTTMVIDEVAEVVATDETVKTTALAILIATMAADATIAMVEVAKTVVAVEVIVVAEAMIEATTVIARTMLLLLAPMLLLVKPTQEAAAVEVAETTVAAMIATLVGKSRLRLWLSRWLGYLSAMCQSPGGQIGAPHMYSQTYYSDCVESSAR